MALYFSIVLYMLSITNWNIKLPNVFHNGLDFIKACVCQIFFKWNNIKTNFYNENIICSNICLWNST